MTTTAGPNLTGSRSKTVRALNEVGRRIQAFAKLTNNPDAQLAYQNALQVVAEVRDSEQG